MILPNPGQGDFPPERENRGRNREIANLAWVPATSRALLCDENDNVWRVLDLKQKTVMKTVLLPDGSSPAGIGVDAAGKQAVVSLRDMKKIAVVDLEAYKVTAEITVESGPGAVAIKDTTALVVNQDSDSVSVVDLASKQVTNVKVGRGPRFVEIRIVDPELNGRDLARRRAVGADDRCADAAGKRTRLAAGLDADHQSACLIRWRQHIARLRLGPTPCPVRLRLASLQSVQSALAASLTCRTPVTYTLAR